MLLLQMKRDIIVSRDKINISGKLCDGKENKLLLYTTE